MPSWHVCAYHLLGKPSKTIAKKSRRLTRHGHRGHLVAVSSQTLGGSWRIVEDCNEQQFHGLPISLEQQCAATTLTDFVDATSRIGRPVWQALDYRLADHGGAEGTKMDQIRKDPDPS
jgi:hypothetical protein